MGFYFRKSVRVGPFRVNFSKSGIGLSAGVPGLRIGTGPRGNYVQAGAHGFYYRAALPSSRSRTVARASAPPRTASESPPIPDHTVGAFAAIESGDASQMADSSSEALLEEIHKKHRRISLWRGVAVLCSFVVCAAWLNDAALWAIGLAAAAGVAVTTLAFRWDVQRKLTILHYDLTPQAMEAFGRLMDAGTHLNQCNRVWHLKGQAAILDRKYHAGASAAVARAAASVGTKMPPFMACNVDPIAVVLTKLTLYFFPDRVFVYQGSRVGAVAYSALDCHVDETGFVEEEPPGDAEVVGHTWRFVNKSG